MKLALLLLALAVMPACAAFLPEYPFIYTSGVATKQLPPDMATVELVIHAKRSTKAEAMQGQQQAYANMKKLLARYGISDWDLGDITCDKVEKYTTATPTQEARLKQTTYDIHQTLTFNLYDMKAWPTLHADLFGKDDVDLSFNFSNKNREDIVQGLRKEAIDNAQKRAASLAESLGKQIDTVMAISNERIETSVTRFSLQSLEDKDEFGDEQLPPPPIFAPQIELQTNDNERSQTEDLSAQERFMAPKLLTYQKHAYMIFRLK